MYKKDNISIPIFLLTLIISSMISFFVFILLLHTPLFNNIKVYMYRGIVLIILSTIFDVILLNILKNILLKSINAKDILSIAIIYISVVMMFFTLVPVTVERSVSVYMLFNIEANDGMTKDDIQKDFIDNYVIENDAFQKRIIEQEVTGSISLDDKDNKYKLTDRGKFITNVFKIVSFIFKADTKLMQ